MTRLRRVLRAVRMPWSAPCHARTIRRPSDFLAIMPPGIAGEREGIAPQTSAERFWRQLELKAMARRVYGH